MSGEYTGAVRVRRRRSSSRGQGLHLPRTAEAIIRHALATVWQPAAGVNRGLEIQDGAIFILSLPADVMSSLGPRE